MEEHFNIWFIFVTIASGKSSEIVTFHDLNKSNRTEKLDKKKEIYKEQIHDNDAIYIYIVTDWMVVELDERDIDSQSG